MDNETIFLNERMYSNELFIELKKDEANAKCFHCSATPSNWADYKNGIFLCAKCSGEHRQFSEEISQILSIIYDEWIEEELNQMKNGGNKRLNDYLGDNGISKQDTPKQILFNLKIMNEYRNDLKSENNATKSNIQMSIPMDYLSMY